MDVLWKFVGKEIEDGNLNEAKDNANDQNQNPEKIKHHGNLASSTIKDMLEHSRISTGQKELTNTNAWADEYLCLSYHGFRAKDNGNGIPKNIVDKVFQSIIPTKPTGQGTKLGLSLSYDIVKAHGGSIQLKSQEKVGNELIIHFPVN